MKSDVSMGQCINQAVDRVTDQVADWLTHTPVMSLRRGLLTWYKQNHRKLPWRASFGTESANPYHVLVSELMLQQTQVATVVDYFNRFITVFPTVHDLAEANEQQVLRLWQGLGYYRRARNLHAAAKMIVEQYEGRVPQQLDNLLQLPGIGRYTAGAVASIAYNQSVPVLDGNVARVLTRWVAIDQPTDQSIVRSALWHLAEKLVPSTLESDTIPRATAKKEKREVISSATVTGDWNQALMELGALVCQPRTPQCDSCPVKTYCQAHQHGLTDQIPAASTRVTPKPVVHHVLAIYRRGKYLFHQRPSHGLWSNMWQLPTLENENSITTTNIDTTTKQWVRDVFGLTLQQQGSVGEFQHVTTHRKIQFVIGKYTSIQGRLRAHSGQWRSLDVLDDLPLANPQRRIVAMLNP